MLLIGILLGGAAGAAMAVALAILAGVMNRDALELTVYVLAGGLASLLAITRAERLNAFVRVFVVLLPPPTSPSSIAFEPARRSATWPRIAQLVGVGVVNAAAVGGAGGRHASRCSATCSGS